MTNEQNETSTLFTVPTVTRERTSDVLLTLIKAAKHADVTLRKLTDQLGDRTFGMLLILVTTFSVIPFVSIISGIIIMILGFQMAIGLTKTWLPKSVLDWKLPSNKVQSALELFEPKVRKIERYLRPRWAFTEAPIVDRINGVIIVILGLVVMIPIPLTNLGPAFAIILLGLGLMERDGLVQIAAATIGLIALGGVYFLAFM
ncbi:exopolysaccharide biosynthesis protein [Marinicellulosiphila megalodicopiae]|uniref:exopolysaccharide biosynthesis protein n=1 Tax=Marinicellulosiphila megalodicopiae TaxID=2724896 RepID=UPI003BAE2B74